MPASLHVARHSASGTARMLRRMRRLRRERAAMPGLVAAHLFFTIEFWAGPTGGIPTPTRWALFCAFDDEEAIARLERSDSLAAFTDNAREAWQIDLEPTRVVSGAWRGWRPQTDGAEPLRSDEPIAVITYGRLRARYVPTFIVNNQRIVAASEGQEGLMARIGLADHVRAACTFSIWRSQRDVVRFAYGADTTHKPIVRPSKDTPWADDYFFARFRLLGSRGTWDGRDPAAEAKAAAVAAANGSGDAGDDALDPGEVSQHAR